MDANALPDPLPAQLEPGRAHPLGAHWDGRGVNFAVVSTVATRVEICLYDVDGAHEIGRLPLPAQTGDVWHGRLDGATPGLVYGLRVHGPFDPEAGHHCNPHKLVLDPYAREIVGDYVWAAEHIGSQPGAPMALDERDNGATALKARVLAEGALEGYDWRGDTPPLTPLADTVLYEVHVKGFTKRHPDVPEALRGSYEALGSDAAIAHLKRIGVTAVSLLPVHQHIDEERLVKLGMTNYWGYNTIGYFALEPRYAHSGRGAAARDEFRGMVQRLHAAGLEVILDVVYNHTAETDVLGPTISFRGLDNALYYRMLPASPGEPAHCDNLTGCGNTLDMRQPRVVQLVMDSLRYWVRELHVDGFRFDLAPVLGRGEDGFTARHAFFQAVMQDPTLAGVKMIAEPWDIGPGGYQVGGFPRGWLEWNDKFRDKVRSYWLGHDCDRGEFARRLCASADVYQGSGRSPVESVNFITAHDGYTLRDLVSYNDKHNEANGEDNRDGHGANYSWNSGVEGETDDPAVRLCRGALQRSLLDTLLLAQGTPMLTAGDELGHTQGGNNNAYCQDNELAWIDWAQADQALIDHTAAVLTLRRERMPLAQRWADPTPGPDGRVPLQWRRPDGQDLEDGDWHDTGPRDFGLQIVTPGRGEGELLMLVNAGPNDMEFSLPPGAWQRRLPRPPEGEAGDAAQRLVVPGRSLWVLDLQTPA